MTLIAFTDPNPAPHDEARRDHAVGPPAEMAHEQRPAEGQCYWRQVDGWLQRGRPRLPMFVRVTIAEEMNAASSTMPVRSMVARRSPHVVVTDRARSPEWRSRRRVYGKMPRQDQ